MAGNPQIVTEDVVFTWDGVSQRLPKGQLIDVPAGSSLEQAIGAGRLVPLNGAAPSLAAPPVAEVQQEESSPAKPRGTAKNGAGTPAPVSDDKDGGA